MKNKIQNEKVELANKIAKKSKTVSKTYEVLELFTIRTFRILSSYIDKWLFNSKYMAFISLLLALLLYLSTNISDNSIIFNTPLNNEKTIQNVELSAIYNSDTFELVNLPDVMDVRIIGSAADVLSASNRAGRIIADLTGYTEGVHTIKLTTEGYGANVEALPTNNEITITLNKKTTKSFPIEYDFINLDKIDNKYVLEDPIFDVDSVMVRGSQETLDTIAFVKVLIDVQNQKSEFSQEAPLIAYNNQGYPVDADVVPKTINVSVDVSTPSNTVPIILETTGNLPDGLSLEEIIMDHTTIQIFASESRLTDIEYRPVTLDLSTINEDTETFVPIILPTGTSSPISRVNLTIQLGETQKKEISNIMINYRNNEKNYNDLVTSITTVTVTVYGTQSNLDKLNTNDIDVYFDLKDAIDGTSIDYQLYVENLNSDAYVVLIPNEPTINVTIPTLDQE